MASRDVPGVAHVVHSLEGGGTERTLLSMLGAWNHETARHVVVTLRKAGSLANRLPDQVGCVALESKGRTRTGGLKLARVVSRLRPAIIHARNVCTWADAVVAAMLNHKVQLVLGFHGLEHGGAFSRRDRFVVRLALASTNVRFMSVSKKGCAELEQQLGIDRTRITHIPNGVDIGRFVIPDAETKTAARCSLRIGAAERVIGIIGSLTPVKGHDLLLSAIARVLTAVPKVRLLVVGDGPLKAALNEQARTHGINDRVTFVGHQEDVQPLLYAMDVYVCSSRSEGTSNALLEAMACGLPILTTAVGDHATVVRHNVDGVVVPAGDGAALAEALCQLAQSQTRCMELGICARKRAEEYTFENSVRAYEQYYQHLLTVHANTAGAVARLCLSVSKSVISAGSARVQQAAPLQ